MASQIIPFIAIFLLVLVTGVFWGNWISLTRSIDVFSETELIRLAKILVQNLAMPMRVISPCCLTFMALSTWFYTQHGSIGFYSSILAIALLVSALLITLLIEVPINNQIIEWTPSTVPSNWEAIRNRWQFFNIFRVVTALASFGFFAAAFI